MSASRRTTRFVLLVSLVGALAAPATATAQEDGVTVDPSSPAGSQYQIPLDTARGVGGSGSKAGSTSSDGQQGNGSTTADSGLFGAGITAGGSGSGSGSGGGGDASPSGASAGSSSSSGAGSSESSRSTSRDSSGSGGSSGSKRERSGDRAGSTTQREARSSIQRDLALANQRPVATSSSSSSALLVGAAAVLVLIGAGGFVVRRMRAS